MHLSACFLEAGGTRGRGGKQYSEHVEPDTEKKTSSGSSQKIWSCDMVLTTPPWWKQFIYNKSFLCSKWCPQRLFDFHPCTNNIINWWQLGIIMFSVVVHSHALHSDPKKRRRQCMNQTLGVNGLATLRVHCAWYVCVHASAWVLPFQRLAK